MPTSRRGKKMARNTTAAERLAVLEQQVSQVTAQLAANSTVLSDIQRQMSRQKGFIGGIVFVVSAVWALAIAAMKFLPIRP